MCEKREKKKMKKPIVNIICLVVFAALIYLIQPAPNVTPYSVRVTMWTLDDDVRYFGSGTIVDQARVLTCAHLFQDCDLSKTYADVEVFDGHNKKKYWGHITHIDFEADIAVIDIPGGLNRKSARISQSNPSIGERLYSVTCIALPVMNQRRVTAQDRYVGPPNIECTGIPMYGASGGGLFNSDGEIVAVCIAGDFEHEKGVYASVVGKKIRELHNHK